MAPARKLDGYPIPVLCGHAIGLALGYGLLDEMDIFGGHDVEDARIVHNGDVRLRKILGQVAKELMANAFQHEHHRIFVPLARDRRAAPGTVIAKGAFALE